MRSDKKSRKNIPIPGTRQYRKTQDKGHTENKNTIRASSSDKKRKKFSEDELIPGSRQYRKAQNRKKKKLFGWLFSRKKRNNKKSITPNTSEKKRIRADGKFKNSTRIPENEEKVLKEMQNVGKKDILQKKSKLTKSSSKYRGKSISEVKHGNKKSFFESKRFLVMIFLIGLVILSFPLVSNKYYEVKQNGANNKYSEKMARMDREKRENIIKEAEIYNSGLANINDNGYSDRVREYMSSSIKKNMIPSFFLSKDPIARLKISSINVDLPVYYGVTDDILGKGVGAMPNTSLPVGGMSTHSVLTGHRGLPESRLFRDLGELKRGDIFSIEILGKKMAYQVDNIKTVNPKNVSDINITSGKDYCTLLTCHPYMINSERMLVRGKRVPYVEYIKETKKKENWMNTLKLLYMKYKEYLYGFLISIVILIVFYIIDKKKNRKSKQNIKNIERKK